MLTGFNFCSVSLRDLTCSLVLRIAITRRWIYNRWVVPYNSAKVDLRRLSCRTRPRRIGNTTGQLPNFKYESGRYHKFLLAYPQEAQEENCWSEVTSTKQMPTVHGESRPFFFGPVFVLGDKPTARTSLYLRTNTIYESRLTYEVPQS